MDQREWDRFYTQADRDLDRLEEREAERLADPAEENGSDNRNTDGDADN